MAKKEPGFRRVVVGDLVVLAYWCVFGFPFASLAASCRSSCLVRTVRQFATGSLVSETALISLALSAWTVAPDLVVMRRVSSWKMAVVNNQELHTRESKVNQGHQSS